MRKKDNETRAAVRATAGATAVVPAWAPAGAAAGPGLAAWAPGRTCAVGAYGAGALRLFLPGKRLKAIDGTGGSGYALGVDQANINSGRI